MNTVSIYVHKLDRIFNAAHLTTPVTSSAASISIFSTIVNSTLDKAGKVLYIYTHIDWFW